MFPDIPRLYEPNNLLRLFTGTGMGLVLASALYPAFTSTVYRKIDQSPALPGLGAFLGMSAGALVLAGLALTNIIWILYPLALISSAGVFVLLGMVYSMVVMMIFRLDNRYDRLSQAVFPLVAGLGVAILQIAIFDIRSVHSYRYLGGISFWIIMVMQRNTGGCVYRADRMRWIY